MPLTLKAVDYLAVIGVIDGHYILDLTPLEFEAVEAVILVMVKEERVMGVELLKGSVNVEEMHKIVRFILNYYK